MRPFPPRLLALLLAPLLAAAATPPTPSVPRAVVARPMLRAMTTLHGPLVRLGDLFANAGPASGQVLGPGPAPGGRIVVAARQLAFIAQRYDVDWHPASPEDRAVLAWPGRPFARGAAMPPLIAALHAAGAGAQARIVLDRFDPPVVPLSPDLTPVVSALAYDPGSGRFTAVLMLTGAGLDPIAVPVAGRVEATVLVPVAAVPLAAGTVLAADDIRMMRMRRSTVPGDAVLRAEQAIGQQIRRMAPAGTPFLRDELRPPVLVRKGAVVLIRVDSPGITLTASGQALDPGGAGDRIRVLNPVSHAVLEAMVTAAGQVRVLPGAPPLIPAGGVVR